MTTKTQNLDALLAMVAAAASVVHSANNSLSVAGCVHDAGFHSMPPGLDARQNYVVAHLLAVREQLASALAIVDGALAFDRVQR